MTPEEARRIILNWVGSGPVRQKLRELRQVTGLSIAHGTYYRWKASRDPTGYTWGRIIEIAEALENAARAER